MSEGPPLLKVDGLEKRFPIRRGLFQRVVGYVRAVDSVSFAIFPGEIYGLAGESGSGKSTIARMIVGLTRPSRGRILLDGEDVTRQQTSMTFKKRVQIVFQNPGSSLNPRRSIGQTLMVPLVYHNYPRRARAKRIRELLEMVELPTSFVNKYPHALSGGQKQRVAIARALAVNPELIVLDEPTSALDVSVQAKVIELLIRLRNELNLAYLFISHDLSLMRNFTSRIGVMYLGKLVETGFTGDVFKDPKHPYTQGLISAVPVVSEEEERLKPKVERIQGEIPSPTKVPSGCSFHTRCPKVFEPCRSEEPAFRTVGFEHRARCHLFPLDTE
jgi:oligopeptide transport system ATP-binding protein